MSYILSGDDRLLISQITKQLKTQKALYDWFNQCPLHQDTV